MRFPIKASADKTKFSVNLLTEICHPSVNDWVPRCLGTNDGCCTEESPCEKNEGDCDEDAQCKDDLVCGSKNCNSEWHGSMDFEIDDDCCMSMYNEYF